MHLVVIYETKSIYLHRTSSNALKKNNFLWILLKFGFESIVAQLKQQTTNTHAGNFIVNKIKLYYLFIYYFLASNKKMDLYFI